MTSAQVMAELKSLGSDSIKRVLVKHGAKEPFFGVKIGDMKPIAKKIKGDQALAMELYATGISDAQYLAGMVADGRRMSAAELNRWAKTASWASMISQNTVAWVASENEKGYDLARKWIDAKEEKIVLAGWATLAALAITRADEELPIKEYDALLTRVVRTIHQSPDLVRYAMNNFVIAVGTYVAPLAGAAMRAARAIGKVDVDMGDTSCRVPDAEDYIMKSRRGAPVAPKRKTVRC